MVRNLTLSIFLAAFSLTLGSCSHKASPPPPPPPKLAENSAAQMKKPYVVLISIDGGRYDYVEREKAPNLLKLRSEGVSADGLISIYPSLTFPNHYSLVTGLTAEKHGLIGNQFYDPNRKEEYRLGDSKTVRDGSWYGGSPLWVTAKKNGMVATSYFWVGSEAEIAGNRPDQFFYFDPKVSIDQRIDQVLAWLKLPEANRPHMITLYFSEVDTAGHHHGPDSKEVRDALMAVDQGLGRLFSEGDKLDLPINYIVVSDHGMQLVDPAKHARPIDGLIDEKDFRIVGGGPLMMLYANDQKAIQPTFQKLKKAQKNFKVYLKKDIPSRYHFKNNPRIPDILIDAQIPYVVGFAAKMKERKNVATHGWDPEAKNMWGMFIARGPAFKKGTRLHRVKNIDVTPLVLKILDLPADGALDGNTAAFEKALR